LEIPINKLSYAIYAFIGIIQIANIKHAIVVTGADNVGKLNGGIIYKITEIEIFSLRPGSSSDLDTLANIK